MREDWGFLIFVCVTGLVPVVLMVILLFKI